ncbi:MULTISPECIES: hypothetical protein [unclassified Gilliamella]|uniref:hypothetical protein n=1 Tax=unclassified Gilliamella TaxID=2685620 RepID=UPI0013266010|nr:MULTISPECIES: hypothetical protein [unclassified Gilliamella]MWN32199.1 hypothetical protein [Gilliamella sp. Pra-s60]MWP29479.1 hypothetical protein [Gilliamella sp. Pra-s54]
MASGIWHLACQTYALNLIDSHSGQKQAPQLFSLPKSFRVAKSTPSSAIFSAKLSPISKRLYKPPLQSKPRLLFKPSLLSKSALVFAPLLLLSYTQGVQALSAQTSKVIEGSAPYLTFDGGRTKATNTDTFLAIELPNGRVITPSTNTSSATNPIMLPSGNFTFNDIHMVIPSGSASINLNSLITRGKWGDDDGDGQGAGGVTASGSIGVVIYDKDGYTVSRDDTVSKCKAPYKVSLNSTGGSLATQYGLPNSSTFSGGRAEYYIKPDSSVGVCYARPNLLYDGTTGIDSNDNPDYAGPANIWNPSKGFLVQSTSPSSYGRNFPTTGADGLYFDLDVVGLDVAQLTWSRVTHGGIMATVANVIPNDNWIPSVDRGKRVARVTLSGPRADSSQIPTDYPGRVARPSLPQTFELVGRDRSGNEVKYGFVIKQWFVNRGTEMDSAYRQELWCNRLGYRLARVRYLTNAKCGVDSSFPCVNSIDGVSPRSSGNHYQRHIGAGFFTEWGSMGNYAGTGFINYSYWTRDARDSTHRFLVNSYKGGVVSSGASTHYVAVCEF